MLKDIFFELVLRYTSNSQVPEQLWTEIKNHYCNKNRHYHSLLHLENLLIQLTEIKNDITDWDTLLFSLYYHDIIYNTKSQKNEEKSAYLAKKRLIELNYPDQKIELCYNQIIATKTHQTSINNDTNLFTDADLSILGVDWESYTVYLKQIRKEYSIYPDFIYKPGRKKVLSHFLNMDCLFKTQYFSDKYESQAKLNIQLELEMC